MPECNHKDMVRVRNIWFRYDMLITEVRSSLQNVCTAAPEEDAKEEEEEGLTQKYQEWCTAIGPDLSRYCALIGWDHDATTALLCHVDVDTAQGTQSSLIGEFLAFRCVFLS